MLPAAKLFRLAGHVYGGCSPAGTKRPLPACIDGCAILYETIRVSAGRAGLNAEINPERLAAFAGARFEPLTRE